MLKYNQYIDNVIDKAWFESSNIVYGECDESETQYKTVRIVFKNGATYQYENVLVSDWVSFKHAESQGKSLNEHFKKMGYKYTRIEDSNLDEINQELENMSSCDFYFKKEDEKLKLFDNAIDLEKYSMPYPGDDIVNYIKEMLESLGYKIKIK